MPSGLTRGQTVQVQGGVGRRFLRLFDLGLAFYGLWQVSSDTGSDIPPALLGIRETGVGLGPELDVLLPWIRGKLTTRYEWQRCLLAVDDLYREIAIGAQA